MALCFMQAEEWTAERVHYWWLEWVHGFNDNGLLRLDGSSGVAVGFKPSGSSLCFSLRNHHGRRVGLGVARGVTDGATVPVGLITILWGFIVAAGVAVGDGGAVDAGVGSRSRSRLPGKGVGSLHGGTGS